MAEPLEFLGLGSAVAWVQVRLRGGWYNILATSAVYGLAVAMTMYIPARFTGMRSTTSYYSGWVNGLLGLQAMILLVFAGSRVTAAVRLDYSTRMIESHRLMPAGPGSGVLGYVLGGTSQGIMLAAVTFVLGLFAAAGAGLPLDKWLWPNLVLGLFAGFTWVVLAYFAFLGRAPLAWMLLPIGAFWLSQGGVAAALPAMTVLCSPLIGWSVFAMRASGMTFPYGVAAVAQVVVGAIFFEAARRKYRRDDVVGLGPGLGLLLLAALVGVSWVGVWQWEEFGPRYLRSSWVDPEVQVLCSLIAMMLVGLVPLAAAARLTAERRRHVDAPAGERLPRHLPDLMVAAAGAACIASLCWAYPETEHLWRWRASSREVAPGTVWRTSVVVLLHLVSFSNVLRLAHLRVKWPRAVAVAWVLLLWIGPVMADLVRYAQTEQTRYDEPPPQALTWISACSPPAALVALWRPDERAPVDTTPGLAVQAGLTVAAMAAYHTLGRRRRAATPPVAVQR